MRLEASAELLFLVCVCVWSECVDGATHTQCHAHTRAQYIHRIRESSTNQPSTHSFILTYLNPRRRHQPFADERAVEVAAGGAGAGRVPYAVVG